VGHKHPTNTSRSFETGITTKFFDNIFCNLNEETIPHLLGFFIDFSSILFLKKNTLYIICQARTLKLIATSLSVRASSFPHQTSSVTIEILNKTYIMYDFKKLSKEIEVTTEHFKNELASIRTGRAAPALLDAVRVDSYGTKVPLNQVGSVTIEDARSLRVTPWEIDAVNQIRQAISDANLGVSVSSDGKGVRVTFPELTSDRRTQLIKLTNTKLEEARIAIRKHRENVWDDIQKIQKAGDMSEDDKFRSKDEMEKLIKAGNDTLEKLAEKKEVELNA